MIDATDADDTDESRSIDLADDAGPVYGDSDTTVRVVDGQGEVTISPGFDDDNEFTFTTPKEEVEEFVKQRTENTPPLPEADTELGDVEAPDGWTGGNARHTGGGIFCREFRKNFRDDAVRVEVVSNIDNPNGVGIVAYDPETGEYLGEIDNVSLDERTEKSAVGTSKELIRRIDNGVYEEEIDEFAEKE